jgi:hypothetical protein
MARIEACIGLAGLLLLGACAAEVPARPSVAALPAAGKSYAQFQQDDAICQQYAAASIGYSSPGRNANSSAAGSAALGTVLGAAAGALFGFAAGDPAAGAAIGAGSGLLFGGLSGAGQAHAAGSATQQAYDTSYLQCMAARGESVPMAHGAPYPYPPHTSYGYSAPSPYPYDPGYPQY